MSRAKRKINVVTILPDGQGREEFQRRVNEAYVELVRGRLLALPMETEEKRAVIGKLIR